MNTSIAPSEHRPRIGIFGVGRMGRVHVENLVRRHRNQEIVLAAIGDRHLATCQKTLSLIQDIDEETAGSLMQYSAPEAMAEQAKLDGAVVGSRTTDHAPDIAAFINRGIPVMVEKPMVYTVTDAVELLHNCEGDPTKLVFTAFQRHYDRAAQAATGWFESGAIGELQQSHHVIQDKNPPHLGYQSGGITSDMAVHLVFEAMSFRNFELPLYVQALRFLAPHYDDQAQEGANIVHTFLTWADGSLAHLWGSRLNVTGYDNGFKLIGTKGRIDVGEFVGDFGEVVAKLWCGNGKDTPERGVLKESLTFPMTPMDGPDSFACPPDFYPRYAEAYDRELAAFLTHINDATAFSIGPEIGWKTLFVANLAEASSLQHGKRIELAIEGKPVQTIEDAECVARTHDHALS